MVIGSFIEDDHMHNIILIIAGNRKCGLEFLQLRFNYGSITSNMMIERRLMQSSYHFYHKDRKQYSKDLETIWRRKRSRRSRAKSRRKRMIQPDHLLCTVEMKRGRCRNTFNIVARGETLILMPERRRRRSRECAAIALPPLHI